MNTILVPEVLFFYLNAGLFYFADLLQKITSEKRWTWGYLTIRSVYTVIISLIITLLYSGFSTFPNPEILLQLVGSSVICGGGLFFYIRAVNHLKFSNAGSLYIVGNVVQHSIGILFLNETFYPADLPAFVLMSTGCIYQLLIGTSFKGAGSVLLSSLCWTIGYVLLSFPLQKANVFWSIPIMEATILFICLVVVWTNKKRHQEDVRTIVQQTHPMRFLLIGVLVTAGSFFNHLSYRDLPVSVVSVLQLSLLPATFLISMRIFRERLNRVEWISFATGLIGFSVFVFNRIHR